MTDFPLAPHFSFQSSESFLLAMKPISLIWLLEEAFKDLKLLMSKDCKDYFTTFTIFV